MNMKNLPKEFSMKRLTIIFLMLVMFIFPSSVLADVAPPINPPGSNPQPGTETTQVRMMAETVLIDVQNDNVPDSLGSAVITADFTMQNLGNVSESMAVRFPISAENGRGEYPEITDLSISVAGKQIQYRRTNYPDIRDASKDIPWAEFDITFPAGQDVPIQVKYKLQGSGYAPYTAFYYILESGAGWKDTIGSADIILRLPYEASAQNVVGSQIGWGETTPGGVFQGNEMRWHFENFEPGPYEAIQNMEFALVAPSAWNTVLKARANVEKFPNDSETWGQLAKTYKSIFLRNKFYRNDPGGEQLYKLSIEAYEKCLALNPNDAQWHAGFADLLANRSYWDFWASGPTTETYRAFSEIRAALQLAPNDAKVLEIANNIHYMFPDGMSQTGNGYDYPWLTQTPTSPPPTPTIGPVYDPATLAGTYQSDTLTLANNTQTRLTLTLRADHSAEMESKGDDGLSTVSTGKWMDNSDSTISIEVADSNGQSLNMKFKPLNDMLQSVEYPSFYGDAGVNMQRLVTATPLPPPPATDTPQPIPSKSAPASKPKSSLPCGSAALAPLAVGIWWIKKRRP
jgi:tetratricopeptide (TPR) repeat protein